MFKCSICGKSLLKGGFVIFGETQSGVSQAECLHCTSPEHKAQIASLVELIEKLDQTVEEDSEKFLNERRRQIERN